MERMKKMKKQPKNAPILVTMILLPYLMIRMALDVILMLIDTLADGFDVLGPRFQGIVIGFFGAISLLIVAINLAIWG